MIGCVRAGWREKGEASYIPGGGNIKARHLVYNIEKHKTMDLLLKAYAAGDPRIVPQDLIDLEANVLREDKLFHLYGPGVRSRLVKSDDPRDKGRVGRQSDQDRIDRENDALLKGVAAVEEQWRREKKANTGATCPLHDRKLVAKSRCPVCGFGYRFFDREGSLR